MKQRNHCSGQKILFVTVSRRVATIGVPSGRCLDETCRDREITGPEPWGCAPNYAAVAVLGADWWK
jgi:hypothetical protein